MPMTAHTFTKTLLDSKMPLVSNFAQLLLLLLLESVHTFTCESTSDEYPNKIQGCVNQPEVTAHIQLTVLLLVINK